MKRLLVLSPLLLAGCVTTGPASVTGGECKVFEAPKYVVRGVAPYDQDWIDSTIEGGVGACKWARPAPRPAELDVPRAKPKHAVPIPKKKPLWLRMLQWHKKAAPAPPPVVAAPAPEPESVAPPPPPAPRAPRSVIDELLQPSADAK